MENSDIFAAVLIGSQVTFDWDVFGLVTITAAVPGFAMSAEEMLAFNCELLTKVVERGLPFQFTVEFATKPVPFTTSVNAGPPGATVAGTRGWLTKGTGFAARASDTKNDKAIKMQGNFTATSLGQSGAQCVAGE